MAERLPRLLVIQSVPLDRAIGRVVFNLLSRREGRYEAMLFLHARDDEERAQARAYADELGLPLRTFQLKRRYTRMPHGLRWLPWKVATLAILLGQSVRMTVAARSFAPDAVYSCQDLWDAIPAEATARLLHRPHIVHSHGVAELLGFLQSFVVRRCAAVISVSRFIDENLANHGVRKNRRATIRNPHPEFDHDIRANRDLIRAEFGIAADALVVGMVSDIRREKRHQDLLRAWKLVAGEFPGARLLIIGDGELLEPSRALAAELGLDAIIPGRRTDIPDVLGAMDIFAHPSVADAAPLAVGEAMSAGLPIIAYREGGVLETVTEGENGLYAESLDVEGLAACLRTLMSDPALRERMGAESAARAARYTWDEAATKFAKIVRKVTLTSRD